MFTNFGRTLNIKIQQFMGFIKCGQTLQVLITKTLQHLVAPAPTITTKPLKKKIQFNTNL
jgi:hypothetical protein